MKTQILMIGFSIAITFFSNPITAQQNISDNPSAEKKSHTAVITIPWYYPPVYDTEDNGNMKEEVVSSNPVLTDSTSETCMLSEETKNSCESNTQERYNNPVKYGIDEYFTLKPKRP